MIDRDPASVADVNRGLSSPPRDAWFRWTTWRTGRGILAALLIAAGGVAAFGFSWRAEFRAELGLRDGLWMAPIVLRRAALDQLLASIFLAAGPLAVWMFRRTTVWLVLSIGAFLFSGVFALLYLIRAAGAPAP